MYVMCLLNDSVVKMTSPSEDLTLEIKKIKDNIRQKYSTLKNTNYETQRKLAIQYKPLIKPLKQLVMNIPLKEEPMGPKDEPTEDESLKGEEDVQEEEDGEVYEIPDLPEESEEEEEEEETPKNVDELLARYLKFILNDTRNEADFTYGIVYDGSWKMGRLPVHFNGNDIIIGDNRYEGTPGLFELIFKKHPTSVFTEDDLNTYKSILQQTKAHLTKEGKIISSRGYKYTNIISNMFPPRQKLIDKLTPVVTRAKRALSKEYLASEEKRKKTGEGVMMRLTKDAIDYRYWDDPNELCYRLRLLIASKEAGNTGLDGEIVSILEELKEAEIIKDFDRVRL